MWKNATHRAAGGVPTRGLALALGLAGLSGGLHAMASEAPEASRPAAGPRTVVDLQPFRRTTSIPIDDGAGHAGRATLIDLAPEVHAWLLLTLAWDDGRSASFHLENPGLRQQRVSLEASSPHGLVLASASRGRESCELWSGSAGGLAAAPRSSAPYAPLCDERLYLRREVPGHRTKKEWVTDLLRDHVWGGDKITTIVRNTFFRDRWVEEPGLARDGEHELAPPGAPPRPRLAEPYDEDLVDARELGLDVAREPGGRLGLGHWVAVRGSPGIFVSAVTPEAISPEVLRGASHRVNELDPVERDALAYLVAFDLDRFELAFSLGTEHPRVGWGDRLLPDARDESLPGPDGIGTLAPLVRTGMLSPALQGAAAATFTGGFKRQHGAFHAGRLAHVHHGSHYGFVEEGVIESRLQPGLATVVVGVDGRVDLRTWIPDDDAGLAHLRFARQNGVALVENDPATGRPGPGALVTQWAAGNWSGSEDSRLRTLRAGLCLLEGDGRRFLVYGYFSSATPSAMARVFLGAGCTYAMHLDMNALEHTYLALYRRDGPRLLVEHLVTGMSVVDQTSGDQPIPRFVAFPDNRDFFTLLRREGP